MRRSRHFRFAFVAVGIGTTVSTANILVACVGTDPETVRNANTVDATTSGQLETSTADQGSTAIPDGSNAVPVLTSCKALFEAGFVSDGVYVIDPDGPNGIAQAFEARCEMTTEGGGWTLAAIVSGREGDAGLGWSTSAV